MLKRLIPAALSLAVMGSAAAPALARHRRDRDDNVYYGDRYYNSDRYDNSDRYYNSDRYNNGRYNNGRYYRRDFGANRQRVADRATRLYQEGRLSRDHYERTMDKLNQRGGSDWANQVDDTLSQWSRSDSRR